MKVAVASIVGLGIVFAAAVGLQSGIGPVAVLWLGLAIAVGSLAIGVAGRAASKDVVPARCTTCDGVISKNAPYCKHCGALVPR